MASYFSILKPEVKVVYVEECSSPGSYKFYWSTLHAYANSSLIIRVIICPSHEKWTISTYRLQKEDVSVKNEVKKVT
jgi:hypothetical protein